MQWTTEFPLEARKFAFLYVLVMVEEREDEDNVKDDIDVRLFSETTKAAAVVDDDEEEDDDDKDDVMPSDCSWDVSKATPLLL